MVATWLTELYLDQINRALLDAHVGIGDGDAQNGGANAAVAALEQQLQVCFRSRCAAHRLVCAASLSESCEAIDIGNSAVGYLPRVCSTAAATWACRGRGANDMLSLSLVAAAQLHYPRL